MENLDKLRRELDKKTRHLTKWEREYLERAAVDRSFDLRHLDTHEREIVTLMREIEDGEIAVVRSSR